MCNLLATINILSVIRMSGRRLGHDCIIKTVVCQYPGLLKVKLTCLRTEIRVSRV